MLPTQVMMTSLTTCMMLKRVVNVEVVKLGEIASASFPAAAPVPPGATSAGGLGFAFALAAVWVPPYQDVLH